MKIVPVSDTSTRMRLSVEHLGALDIPASLVELRTLTAGMLPRIDLPELLLEVHAWTGYLNSYVHVSGENTRMTTGQGLPPDGRAPRSRPPVGLPHRSPHRPACQMTWARTVPCRAAECYVQEPPSRCRRRSEHDRDLD